MQLSLFLLPLLPLLVAGHGAVVHPPPRNRVIVILMMKMSIDINLTNMLTFSLAIIMIMVVKMMTMMISVVMMMMIKELARWTVNYPLGLDLCLVLFQGWTLGLFFFWMIIF